MGQELVRHLVTDDVMHDDDQYVIADGDRVVCVNVWPVVLRCAGTSSLFGLHGTI